MYNIIMDNNQTFRIEYCDQFAAIDGDNQSQVFQIFPKIFNDDRGFFTEVLSKSTIQLPIWMQDFSWISQINKSSSHPGVCRGLHAQKGQYCQSKLVECLNGVILDIIVDARPDSASFKHFSAFILDSKIQNKLFVPKGFLHGFYSMKKDLNGMLICENNIFQYYVGGGSYNKECEVNVDMTTIMRQLDEAKQFDVELKSGILQSEKDGKNAISLESFFSDIQSQYTQLGKLWYR